MLPLKRTVSWWVKGESGVDGGSKYGHRPSDNHVFPKWGLVGANLISILECIGYIVDAESATDLCAAIRSECPMDGEKSINKVGKKYPTPFDSPNNPNAEDIEFTILA